MLTRHSRDHLVLLSHYEPLTAPIYVDIALGTGNGGELAWTIQFSLVPGLRVGYKQLLLDGPVLLAADVGGSFYLGLAAFDLGLLGSVPLDGWEPYFGARGFLTPIGITGAITEGTRLGGDFSVYLELTLATQGFVSQGRGSPAWRQSVPTVGWLLIPAIGIRF